jgi:hypothetical protein
MKKCNFFQIIPAVSIFIFLLSSPFYGADKKLLIFPLNYAGDPSKAYISQTIKKMLSTKLSGEGIELIEDEKYNLTLTEKEKQGIIQENKIKEISGKLNANYAVYGNVISAGTSASIDLFILNINKQDSKPLKISDIVDENQLIAKITEISGKIRSIIQSEKVSSTINDAKPAITKTQSAIGKPLSSLNISGDIPVKNTQIMAFDIVDVDGDGNPEWLILETGSLMVYSKENGAMVKKDSLKSSLGESFLKVSAGDIDGNGKPEIYIVTLYGSIVRTVVLEWAGKYNKLFNFQGNLRVIKETTFGKPVLIFQDSGADEPLIGGIYLMLYGKDGKLNYKEPLKQLNNVQFYTLTFVDFDKDGTMEYAGLDFNSYLHIWDKDGNSLWQSKDEMGGTNNLVLMDTGNTEQRPDSPNPIIPLNSRLVMMDIDRDENNEIIVVQNISSLSFSDRLKYFKKGYINILKIDGKKLVFAWTSDKIDQCITEIQTDGMTLFFTTEDGRQASIFKGTSHVKWFD